jgi:hypothetical protein
MHARSALLCANVLPAVTKTMSKPKNALIGNLLLVYRFPVAIKPDLL